MKTKGKTSDSANNALSPLSLDGLTPQQRRAVEERGRVLVAASAGSGKTTAMVKKIIRAVAAGVPLKDMLVLVYNEAAANELRERLHGALFEAACLSDGEQRELFRRNLDDLASANIGTIHAFCRALIKENFEKLGISPSFDILSGGEEERYMDRAMDEVFAEYCESKDEVFARLADVLSGGRKEDALRAAVRGIYAVTEIQPDRKKFADGVRASYADATGGEYARVLVEGVRRELARVRKVLEELLPVHSATGQTSYETKSRAVAELCRQAESADFAGICRIAAGAEGVLSVSVKRTKGADDDAVDISKEAFAAAKSVFSEWNGAFGDAELTERMHAQNAVFADKLFEIAERLDDAFAALKRADDVMTYADLEYFAAELVRTCDFKGRFKAVFVDEYQDVNPVQEFIINSLLPDDAFMVGDVKQCIYAFRLADPGIFLERKERYVSDASAGKAVEFNANFRSVNAVLGFVNELFDVIMTKDTSGVDYAADGHFEVGEDKKGADGNALGGCAEVHVFPYCGNSNKSGIYAEARFIATRIKSIVGRACGADGKPLGYGDCVVLVRERSSSARRLAEYVAAEGVPVDAGIFAEESSRAEDELVRFLTVLDNPRSDVPLAGFMLSCFGGFDESELALIAAERPEGGDFYDAVLAAAQRKDPLGEKTAAMLRMLDAYRLKASFRSVPELLGSIVSDFDYDACVEALWEGSAEKVISFITSRAGKDSASDISRFLASYASAGDKRPDKRPAGGNKVRFATYHSYKGLEAPVVFADVAGRTHRGGRSVENVLTDNRGYVGLNYFDFDRRSYARTLSVRAVKKMKGERERREEMRLYYVLLTRAKQYLYVTGAYAKKKAESFGRRPLVKAPESLLDYISEVKYENGLKTPCFVHEISEDAPPAVRTARPAAAATPRREDEEAIRAAVGFRYPYAAETGLSMKYSVSALDGGGDELTLGAFADRADEGIIYHKVMERIDFGATGADAVRAELERMTAEGTLTAEEAAQVDVSAVVRCLESPVMQKARESRCYREKSFLMYVPAADVGQGSSEDKVLVQGVIDLLIDGDERIIVDFKNSLLRNEEALEKYKKQLKLYKKAVESSFLGKVDKILLYSFKTGRTVDAERDI